jgi:hypothetical protein
MKLSRLLKACLLCAAAAAPLLCSACATGPKIRIVSDGAYAPRPHDYEIALTENDFKEPYVEIAQVTTRFYEDRMVDQLCRVELRRAARKLGGDAVVRIGREALTGEELGYRPGGLFRRGTRFVDKYALTGVVVRFDRNGKR